MPRYPKASAPVTAMGGSPYSALAHKLAAFEGEVYPFHVGDTWMEPAVGCRMQDLPVEEFPGMHRYAPPHGLGPLLEGLAVKERRRTGLETGTANILVTTGATGGLASVVSALVEPGDEVLILTPYWPLIGGMVRAAHGRVIEVPVLGPDDGVDSPEGIVEKVERHATERTVALYVSTPNNPSGRILPRPWLEALAEWARRRDLWVFSDEVYEDFVHTPGGTTDHVPFRPLAPERTVAVYSFSKAYGLAGNRCGYLVGPEATVGHALKVSTNTVYSVNTAAQRAAIRVLEGRADGWLQTAQAKYAELGRMAADRLGVPRPEGSAFLFLDVSSQLDPALGEAALLAFLERCADHRLLAAPGTSFGPYPRHIRVCYTCAAPDIVERGIEVLAGLLGR
jgi:N-succinyldiaminopimelate aminotransferase